jgi:hypothetical protein
MARGRVEVTGRDGVCVNDVGGCRSGWRCKRGSRRLRQPVHRTLIGGPEMSLATPARSGGAAPGGRAGVSGSSGRGQRMVSWPQPAGEPILGGVENPHCHGFGSAVGQADFEDWQPGGQ